MLGLTDSILEQIIVHKVGNKSRDENIYVSPSTLVLDDGVKELLHKYFLSSFKSTEYYTLYDESDVNDNVRCISLYHSYLTILRNLLRFRVV